MIGLWHNVQNGHLIVFSYLMFPYWQDNPLSDAPAQRTIIG